MRRLRFGLKSLFILTALVAVYLGWRLRDPEAQALSVIHQAGGKTYFGYQHPWMGSTKFISFAMLPDYEYYSQHDLTCLGPSTQPELSLVEILFGESKERRVNTVALRLDQVTPQMEKSLLSLTELRYLVIEMPAQMSNKDSPEAKRLRELQAKFEGKVWPTVNLGM